MIFFPADLPTQSLQHSRFCLRLRSVSENSRRKLPRLLEQPHPELWRLCSHRGCFDTLLKMDIYPPSCSKLSVCSVIPRPSVPTHCLTPLFPGWLLSFSGIF